MAQEITTDEELQARIAELEALCFPDDDLTEEEEEHIKVLTILIQAYEQRDG